jgi:hypothetical protein
MKKHRHIAEIAEILLKVALNTITPLMKKQQILIVNSLTRPRMRLKSMICCTQGNQANHYTTSKFFD